MWCRLKDFRRVATRYDKLARNYLAGVFIAATIAYWLNRIRTLGRDPDLVLFVNKKISFCNRSRRKDFSLPCRNRYSGANGTNLFSVEQVSWAG